MNKLLSFIIFIILILFYSCENIFFEDVPENTPESIFKIVWKTIDEKYPFFEYKRINWDSVKSVYEKRISNNMTEQQLFDVLGDMLFELKDGHVNLLSQFNRSRNWDWYLIYPPNFNWTIIERNYLRNDYFISGPLLNQVIDSVGYIYYSSFSNDISDKNIDFVIDKFAEMKGIIIDIRDNGGGSLDNANKIASHFTDKKYTAGYMIYKTGPEHDDFGVPIPLEIEPAKKIFQKKVVVLTNRKTYSAANFFTMYMKQLQNVKIIGDKTGGGGGLPIYYELPNGWILRFSSTITLDINGLNIENGIEPDIKAFISTDDEINEKDAIIEKAIDYIIKTN
jgi:hypothetical protein